MMKMLKNKFFINKEGILIIIDIPSDSTFRK